MNDDYILQVKVRNGPLLRRMREAGYPTASALAVAAGVEPGIVGAYLNLKKVPTTSDGSWRATILRIADCLRVLPEDLFPPQHIREALAQNTAETSISLDDIQRLTSAGEDEMLEIIDRRNALSRLLPVLDDRRRRIIEMRYGLDDGHPKAHAEIADALGVSKARVSQMEITAMRKLQGAASLSPSSN